MVFFFSQGTVLGPVFFFIICINGLNINANSKIICFADDTVILIHEKSIEQLYYKLIKYLNFKFTVQ